MIQLTEKLDTQEPQNTLLPGGRRAYANKGHRALGRIGLQKMGYDYFNETGDEENPFILEYKATDVAMKIVMQRMFKANKISTEQLNHLYSNRMNMDAEISEIIANEISKLEEPTMVLPLHRRILQWAGSLFAKKPKKEGTSVGEEVAQADEMATC